MLPHRLNVEVTAQVEVVQAHVDAEAQFDVHAQFDIDGCSFMYTNIDSYLNKRSEFLSIVDKRKPKIIALTEILAKNHKCIHLPEHELPGYDMFVNKNPKRGVFIL